MHVLITCKYEKDPIKNSRENVMTSFSTFIIFRTEKNGIACIKNTRKRDDALFPIITLWEHGNQVLNLHQNLMQPFPHPNDASDKIWL